jgi:hypothetical protein
MWRSSTDYRMYRDTGFSRKILVTAGIFGVAMLPLGSPAGALGIATVAVVQQGCLRSEPLEASVGLRVDEGDADLGAVGDSVGSLLARLGSRQGTAERGVR